MQMGWHADCDPFPMKNLKLAFIICLSILVSGCATQPISTVQTVKPNTELPGFVRMYCVDTEKQGKVLGNCDSVTEEYFLTYKNIEKAACADKGLDGKQCDIAMVDVLMVRLKLKYPHADWAQARMWCDANPGSCGYGTWQGVLAHEVQLLLTHDQFILEASRRRPIQQPSSLNNFVYCTTTQTGPTSRTSCF